MQYPKQVRNESVIKSDFASIFHMNIKRISNYMQRSNGNSNVCKISFVYLSLPTLPTVSISKYKLCIVIVYIFTAGLEYHIHIDIICA